MNMRLGSLALVASFLSLASVPSHATGPIEDGQVIRSEVPMGELSAYLTNMIQSKEQIAKCAMAVRTNGEEKLSLHLTSIAKTVRVDVMGPGKFVHTKFKNGTFGTRLEFTDMGASTKYSPSQKLSLTFRGDKLIQIKAVTINLMTNKEEADLSQTCTDFWSGSLFP